MIRDQEEIACRVHISQTVQMSYSKNKLNEWRIPISETMATNSQTKWKNIKENICNNYQSIINPQRTKT